MPEFKLEYQLPNTRFDPLKNKRLLVTKNVYHPYVKVTDWQTFYESIPYDTNPYCEGKYNNFLSHYNRLGVENCYCYSTTTNDMLEQCHLQNNFSTKVRKKMMNYYSYKDSQSCKKTNYTELFPKNCAPDFSTTMQDSYGLPHHYEIKRLGMEKTPWMKNRFFKGENPFYSIHKFYDEGFDERTKLMRCHKQSKFVSFNPCTFKYTDGKSFTLKRPYCYKLDY